MRARQELAQLVLPRQELLELQVQQELLQVLLPGVRLLRSEFLNPQEQELPPVQPLVLRAGL